MFEMMGLMSASMMTFVLLPLVTLGTAIPIVIYLVARWRDRGEHAEHPDQQIGIKVALNLFRLITFQLTLMAIFMFLLAVISDAPTGDFIRLALGLGIPSAGLCFFHTIFLGKTNATAYPAVGRMFDGWNLIITAIPGMVGIIALFLVILAPALDGQRGDILRAVFPYVMTYGAAWAFLAVGWFRRSGLIAAAPPGAGSMGPPGQGGYPQQGQGYPQQQQGYPQQQQGYPQQGQPQQGQPPQQGGQLPPGQMPPGPGTPGGGYYNQ